MNNALWIVAGLLAFVFVMAGFMKVSQPKETLKEKGMGFVDDFSAGQVRLIGILEVLGAVGLILPALTGILPILTPLAAVGLAYGSSPGDANWNSNADVHPIGGNGVINIFDLATVGLNYGNTC